MCTLLEKGNIVHTDYCFGRLQENNPSQMHVCAFIETEIIILLAPDLFCYLIQSVHTFEKDWATIKAKTPRCDEIVIILMYCFTRGRGLQSSALFNYPPNSDYSKSLLSLLIECTLSSLPVAHPLGDSTRSNRSGSTLIRECSCLSGDHCSV